MSRILAVIPARGGSKRIPKKNVKLLGGLPLIAWSITSVQGLSDVSVMVSTDDDEIASVAKQYGVAVPFMRSSAYATDLATVIDAVLEVVDYYKKEKKYFDAVLLLQPTSPFRTVESIKEAILKYNEGNQESVVSVSPTSVHPYWCKRVKSGQLLPFDNHFDDSVRSQDLPNIYQLNGSIYLSSVANLRENKSFYSENTQALIIESEEESLDIDTPFDWLVAEVIANKREGNL